MSSGAQQVTHYIKEVTPGTTPLAPANGDWKLMRFTGNTLSPTPSVERSEEITQGRLTQGGIATSVDITGDISGELSYGTYDDWLEALFYGTWSNDVLTIGTTRRSFSVQKAFADVPSYHIFKGVHVATGKIEIPETGKVAVTFGCQAMDYADAATTYVSGTPAVATTTPFVSNLAVGDVKIDNSVVAACVSALTLDIDNSVQLQRCLGSKKLGPGDIVATEAVVTGTMNVAWSAAAYALWKTQLARTNFKLTFPITDSLGNKYDFELPNIEFDGELPSGGKTDIIQAALNYTAVKNSIKITRTAA